MGFKLVDVLANKRDEVESLEKLRVKLMSEAISTETHLRIENKKPKKNTNDELNVVSFKHNLLRAQKDSSSEIEEKLA